MRPLQRPYQGQGRTSVTPGQTMDHRLWSYDVCEQKAVVNPKQANAGRGNIAVSPITKRANAEMYLWVFDRRIRMRITLWHGNDHSSCKSVYRRQNLSHHHDDLTNRWWDEAIFTMQHICFGKTNHFAKLLNVISRSFFHTHTQTNAGQNVHLLYWRNMKVQLQIWV